MAVSLGDNSNASQQIFKAFHDLRMMCNNGARDTEETFIGDETIEQGEDIKFWQQDDKEELSSRGRNIDDLCDTNSQDLFRFTGEFSKTQPAPNIIPSNGLGYEAIQSNILPSKLYALLNRILEQPPGEKW